MEEMTGIGDLDDKKVIDNKLELCSTTYNNSKILIKREASDHTSDDTEDLTLQDDSDNKTNIMQSGVQPQYAIDEVQIKHEVDSDSDVEVDLAYSIIDTFNVCEVKSFKREIENISPDSETSFNTELQNETAIVGYLDSKVNTNFSVSGKGKYGLIHEHMNLEDDVKKTLVHQLQNKGM